MGENKNATKLTRCKKSENNIPQIWVRKIIDNIDVSGKKYFLTKFLLKGSEVAHWTAFRPRDLWHKSWVGSMFYGRH